MSTPLWLVDAPGMPVFRPPMGEDIGGVGYTTNVLATKAGVVITSKLSSSYGNYVVISHGPGNTTLYAHMSSRAVKEGDTVTQGQIIGVTGDTGISRGAHLHYEITENGSRVPPLAGRASYSKYGEGRKRDDSG